MKKDFSEEDRYLKAERRVNKIKGFYWHLFWYLAVNVFILFKINKDLDPGEDFFQLEHFSTLFFWGIGLGFHWIGVFGRNLVFSKDWEERKIKEFMDKDRKS